MTKEDMDKLIEEAIEQGHTVEKIDISEMDFREGMDELIRVVNEAGEHMIIPSSTTSDFCAIIPMCQLEEAYKEESK